MELLWEEYQDVRNVSGEDLNSITKRALITAVDIEMTKTSKIVILTSNWIKSKDNLGND